MNTLAEKLPSTLNHLPASKAITQYHSIAQLTDNRPEAIAQRKLQDTENNSPQAARLRTLQRIASSSPQAKRTAQLHAISTGIGTVQLVLDGPFTDVASVEKITNDVWAVRYSGGDIIIKFKGDLAGDVFADATLKGLGANAPGSKLVAANILFTGLNAKWFPPEQWKVLRERLKGMGTEQVLVADKLSGAALGKNAETKSEALTAELVRSAQFANGLGKVAAFDLLLGHQDRIILGSLNLGNMMSLPSDETELQQIDNQIGENDFGLQMANLKSLAIAIKNKTASAFGMRIHRALNLAMNDDPTTDCGFQVASFEKNLRRYVDSLAGQLDALVESLKDVDIKGKGPQAILKRNIERFKAAQVEAREEFEK